MHATTKVSVVAVLAGITIAGMLLPSNILLPKAALASSSTTTTANHFGQASSALAHSSTGAVGQHASHPPGWNPPNENAFNLGRPGRAGIGNVGTQVCNEKLTPGQLADVLNGGSCP